MILLTVLGAVARSAFPEVHQLLRFAAVVAITVAVWLVARAARSRFPTR